MTDPFVDLPKGEAHLIHADPAWLHRSRSPKGQTSRSPSHHYSTMSLAEIEALPVRDLAAPDCHLFMWVPGPHLVKGQHIPIMRAWGFEPSAMGFAWIKINPSQGDAFFLTDSSFFVGMGYTTRKNADYCVIGRRGKPKRKSKSVRELLLAMRREHSRKPDEVYRRLEAYSDGPYVDLFARQSRPGWSTWGNEKTKYDEVAR